jgi:hypothetical protein
VAGLASELPLDLLRRNHHVFLQSPGGVESCYRRCRDQKRTGCIDEARAYRAVVAGGLGEQKEALNKEVSVGVNRAGNMYAGDESRQRGEERRWEEKRWEEKAIDGLKEVKTRRKKGTRS